MKKRFTPGAVLAVVLLALLPSFTMATATYQFPIADRYDATVIGTPPDLVAALPETIPTKVYRIRNLGKMPRVFWYNDALRFSAALQDHPAPLVFAIAGTGASYNSGKLVQMQKALYQAGFHVINISSPTQLNFQLSASTSHRPGYAPDDAQDLYRVMQQAYGLLQDDIEVTGFHIAGYSLGALHAAFIANIDKQQQKFHLQKVYMINPPVNLYNSAAILDALMTENIPSVNGAPNAGAFLNNVIEGLAQSYEPDQGVRFDNDFLYTAYSEAKDHGVFRDSHTAEGLIGFAFRLTSGAMVFAADVMTHSGYVVPKEKTFKRYETLLPYAYASHIVTFREYVDDVLMPYLLAQHPGRNRQQLIQDASLQAIEPFLKNNPDIHIATNRDEIILAEGELAYLENLMGHRLTVYPAGGHCGNINHKTNIADMVTFLQGGHTP